MRHGALESEGSIAAVARAVGEVAVIMAIFAAAGAWPAPDVNEAVYLTKARHAGDPAWGAGDFFLETPDAHGAFYLLLGPLAAALPLDQAAWVGRMLGWLALAAGFRHAVAPLLATPWARLVAAALFSLALRHTTMAGEWVIGGCEAKVFSWALVLTALGEWCAGRVATSWLTFGAASALHPIVGGWSMIAMVLAMAWRAASQPRATVRWASTLPLFILIGLALAAIGVVPSLFLSAGADAATRLAAARIHVVERLNHHLLPRAFAEPLVARHLLAILAWWLLERLAPATEARSRLTAFTVGALLISLAGFIVSLAEPFSPAMSIGLLRFYWFRLADVAVPFALAVAAAAVLQDNAVCARVGGVPPRLLRAGVALLLAVDLLTQSGHWPLAGRTGLVPRADAKVDAAAWADICDWVRVNAPADACFLTPRGAATFTWRTDRREVVSWKNSPQDARSLVEWRRRIVDCFSPNGGLAGMEQSTAALGPDRVRLVMERYGADHAIVPLDAPRIAELPGRRLHANDLYAVYRLETTPPPAAP